LKNKNKNDGKTRKQLLTTSPPAVGDVVVAGEKSLVQSQQAVLLDYSGSTILVQVVPLVVLPFLSALFSEMSPNDI